MGEIIIKVPGEVREVFEINTNYNQDEISKVKNEIEKILKKIERERLFTEIVKLGEEIKDKDTKETEGELYEWLSNRY
jgi:23S rRNA pseudoU1915 N3-methylase RlmH